MDFATLLPTPPILLIREGGMEAMERAASMRVAMGKHCSTEPLSVSAPSLSPSLSPSRMYGRRRQPPGRRRRPRGRGLTAPWVVVLSVAIAAALFLAGCNVQGEGKKLADQARALWEAGVYGDAARNFVTLADLYPDSPLAEESLYLAASFRLAACGQRVRSQRGRRSLPRNCSSLRSMN